VVLLQNGHSHIAWNANLALCRLKLATQNTQKCTFTRTVCTDYAIAVSGGEFEAYILKKNLSSKIEG
jgi:hypothetical protein